MVEPLNTTAGIMQKRGVSCSHFRNSKPVIIGIFKSVTMRSGRETGLPVRVVGMIVNAKQAEAIIAEGKADMIAMARAFLDDPHWAWHAAQILGADVARPPRTTGR